MTTRTTQIRPSGNYLEGLNYDPRQAIANLEKVLGRLPEQEKYDYTGQQARTFDDLTELLLKRAPRVIQHHVTGLIEKSYVSPYTTFLLPIRQLGELESTNVTWTEINFNPGFVDQVEVLGLGRYFTHNKTRRGARAVRRGAAIKIEAGFFMTAEGREMWANQIEQLATAIQETNEYDVLLTLLQVPMRQEIRAQDMNGPYNHMFYGSKPDMTFNERLVLMRDMFSMVNKTPDSRGFQGMVTNLKTIMERNGTTPDAIIVPPYLVGFFYYTKDDLWQHQSAGPAVSANREMATEINSASPFKSQTIQNLKIVDSHVYRPVKGSRNSANDLLTIPVQIGEFYPMCIDMVHRDTKSFENFRASSRDIQIFNEEQSRFVPVYFLDALKHTFRWNQDPDTGDIVGNGALSSYHSPANNLGAMSDMFKSGGNTVNTWGEMDISYLPDEAVDRMVKSVKGNHFSPAEWDAFTTAVDAGAADAQVNKILSLFDDAPALATIQGYITDFTTAAASGSGKWPQHEALFRASKNGAEKAVAAIFLESTINYMNIKKLHEADIFVPIDIILSRPWMTYYASTVVVMKAGRETGETIIGRQDFQMSSNTQTRELEASMVYYGKAIVQNSRNVMVAPHVFVQKYMRGNNVMWVTAENLREIEDNSGLVSARESLVSMLVPYSSKVYNRNWIDFRGFNPNEGDVQYHRSADFYKEVFLTDETQVYNPSESFIDYEDQSYPANTICWIGHINYGVDFKQQSLCQGHLGSTTYDQVNNSRKEGMYSPIRSLHFSVSQH